ncbi:MAG: bifunctional oligoribonuclease/PAP phosphatase NrnA [Sphaerochaetaceae bacterium]|nr:bifunctional oligoribonuclease/PAP phosphatase NrnA [Sphaerochaetaceae bacterium]
MEELKKAIFAKIVEYEKIIIMRHVRPDGDAIGSTLGLASLIRATFPDKDVKVINSDTSDYMAFLGKEDEDVEDSFYKEALGIALDCGDEERLSNKKAYLCKELIKIDHHIDIKPYGDLCWIEEERSSTCELIVDFYLSFCDQLILTQEGALCLYTGMVTDSGRFKFKEVNGETLRCASVLLDKGLDTQSLYARLYLEDFDYYKFQAYVFNKMNITPNGVAWLFVDKEMQNKFSLSREQASSSVSFMEGIKGSIIWIAFIENEDKTIRVRLRSRFVTVNELAEKYHGGGHSCASGATCYTKEEMEALLLDADKIIKDFKDNNEGWI